MGQNLISIGSTVRLIINGAVKEFQIVGSADIDVKNDKISFLSPIGEAVLGKASGQKIKIYLPQGKTLEADIIEIK